MNAALLVDSTIQSSFSFIFNKRQTAEQPHAKIYERLQINVLSHV